MPLSLCQIYILGTTTTMNYNSCHSLSCIFILIFIKLSCQVHLTAQLPSFMLILFSVVLQFNL